MMNLDSFASDVIKKYKSARPEYAPPHKTIFNVAKAHGLKVGIDGELEEARKDWCNDLIDEGVDDYLRVDVYAQNKRVGTIVFHWKDEREVAVKRIDPVKGSKKNKAN